MSLTSLNFDLFEDFWDESSPSSTGRTDNAQSVEYGHKSFAKTYSDGHVNSIEQMVGRESAMA